MDGFLTDTGAGLLSFAIGLLLLAAAFAAICAVSRRCPRLEGKTGFGVCVMLTFAAALLIAVIVSKNIA